MSELWDDPSPADFTADDPIQESFAVQEQPAVVSEEPAAVADTPARDEQGRFVAGQTEEPQAEEPETPLLLGKYKTAEDLVQAHEELYAKLGEQSEELGRLRKLEREQEEQRQAPQQQQTFQPQYDLDALTEAMLERPTQIPQVAHAAFEEGNDQVYQAALHAWRQVDEPSAEAYREWAIQERATRAAVERIQQTNQNQAQLHNNWSVAAQQFAASKPDFNNYTEQIKQIAPQYPEVVALLQNGKPETQVQVLDFLYTKAREGHAASAPEQARDIMRQQAEEAAKAIRDATIASATNSAASRTLSPQEQIRASWEPVMAPYSDENWIQFPN